VKDAKGNIVRQDRILISHEKKELPQCFGYVNDNDDWLQKQGIKRVKNCKTCELLEKCMTTYDERIYNEWSYVYDMEEDEEDIDWDDDDDDPVWDEDLDGSFHGLSIENGGERK